MRFDKNSSSAFRGEFGMNHEASKMDTSVGESAWSWVGDNNKGTLDVDV
jgi:hypothetical protein